MRWLSSIWIPLSFFHVIVIGGYPSKSHSILWGLWRLAYTDINGMPLSLTIPESKENSVYTENSTASAAISHQSRSGNQNIKYKKDFILFKSSPPRPMHLPQMHECNAKFLKLLLTEDFTVKPGKSWIFEIFRECLICYPQTLDLKVQGSTITHCTVSLDKELYSNLSLFTQVYRWLLATYCWGGGGGGNPAMD